MPTVVQLNLIVAYLERSRAFYDALGFEFDARKRDGHGPAEAWVSTNTGLTVVLHSTGFASWWDDSGPEPAPGGAQMDVELESVEQQDAVLDELVALGAEVVKPATVMPWGTRQRFAIVRDPDGHRVGLKVRIDR